MAIGPIILTVLGLCLFEIVSSIDNAIINAEVLSTLRPRARKWFLLWGLLFAVVLVRGLLPWLIVWFATPSLGPLGALTAAFSGDPKILGAVEASAPILLVGGGTFLVFLFFHWLFLEEKEYGIIGERFFHANGVWFYAVISFILSAIVWSSLRHSSMMAFGAVLGSTTFFVTHGLKQRAEEGERSLTNKEMSSFSKLLYLEIIDATFSVDGVLGAFAFTMSVPLILIGNGLGALVVRQLTMGNIDRIKRYVFLKNGAMYSILFLGIVMLLDSFGHTLPNWMSPLITFVVVGFFLFKSVRAVPTPAPERNLS